VLQQERDARRKETQSALVSLNAFTSTWVNLELTISSLLSSQPLVESILSTTLPSATEPPKPPEVESTGDDVEGGTALLDKVARTLSASERQEGEIGRGAKDRRSVSTTICCMAQ